MVLIRLVGNLHPAGGQWRGGSQCRRRIGPVTGAASWPDVTSACLLHDIARFTPYYAAMQYMQRNIAR
jgi:hypothetical protein